MMASGISPAPCMASGIGPVIRSGMWFAAWAGTLESSEVLSLNVHIYFSLNSIVISVSVTIIVEVVNVKGNGSNRAD